MTSLAVTICATTLLMTLPALVPPAAANPRQRRDRVEDIRDRAEAAAIGWKIGATGARTIATIVRTGATFAFRVGAATAWRMFEIAARIGVTRARTASMCARIGATGVRIAATTDAEVKPLQSGSPRGLVPVVLDDLGEPLASLGDP